MLKGYDFYQEQIAECDEELQKYLADLPSREAAKAEPACEAAREKTAKQLKKIKTRRKVGDNRPNFDLGTELERLMGVDLRIVDGVDLLTAQVFYSELGPDLSAWPTEKHFTSWLELSPRRDVSGGKVIKQEKRIVKNRIANALRNAAQTLARSNSYLGARYRHLKARLGGLKAVKAMARYLACLIYRLLTKGPAWVDRGAAYFENKRQERELQALHRKAAAKGMRLVPAA